MVGCSGLAEMTESTLACLVSQLVCLFVCLLFSFLLSIFIMQYKSAKIQLLDLS